MPSKSLFDYCPTCCKYVRVNQKGICCSICHYWYDTSCCNVSILSYIRMGSCNEDWFCMSCLSLILPFITCDTDAFMSDICGTLNYSDLILNRANYLLTKFKFWIVFVILCIFLIIRRIMLFLIERVIIMTEIKLKIKLLKLVLTLNYLVCTLIVAVLRHIWFYSISNNILEVFSRHLSFF